MLRIYEHCAMRLLLSWPNFYMRLHPAAAVICTVCDTRLFICLVKSQCMITVQDECVLYITLYMYTVHLMYRHLVRILLYATKSTFRVHVEYILCVHVIDY